VTVIYFPTNDLLFVNEGKGNAKLTRATWIKEDVQQRRSSR